jgi:hypothetical protein
MDQTFKLLKITRVDGSIDHVPNNRLNLKLHNEYRNALSKEKQEKYKIEPVELDVEEAAKIGVQEAHAILHPTKKKSTQASADTLAQLLEAQLESNRLMQNRLDAMEADKTPKTIEPIASKSEEETKEGNPDAPKSDDETKTTKKK